MPEGCLRIAKRFTNDANFITIKREQLTLEGISQFYITTENDKIKYDTISDLYETIIINQLMIYCNTKQRVMYLADNLRQDGYACSCIHSDLPTNERMNIMQNFRNGETRVLISTDLLARGIDVQQVSLVINYDIPKNPENYLHRIGRSGRFGRKGVALNFICRYDVNSINHIEKFYETEIKELPANIDDIFNQR
jgi:translation initiation factor 4A